MNHIQDNIFTVYCCPEEPPFQLWTFLNILESDEEIKKVPFRRAGVEPGPFVHQL